MKSQCFFDNIKVFKKGLNYRETCAIVKWRESEYGGSWVTGVPPGLQNQCWALGASWVGSIPTCLRQKENRPVNMRASDISREMTALSIL